MLPLILSRIPVKKEGYLVSFMTDSGRSWEGLSSAEGTHHLYGSEESRAEG